MTEQPSRDAFLTRPTDRTVSDGDHRPLLGIPIIVKDNVNTTGKPTTAGSWALAGSTTGDEFIARKLKAEGAIIIGKANLSRGPTSGKARRRAAGAESVARRTCVKS